MISLIPRPKLITPAVGSFRLPADVHVVLQDHPATRTLFPAERFILEAEALTGCDFHLTVGEGIDAAGEIRVRFEEAVARGAAEGVRDQAYRLTIAPGGITLAARAAAGIFYGFQTLLQIVRDRAVSAGGAGKSKIKNQKSKIVLPPALPCLAIEDHPDFPRRGFYHDTARGKVPALETLLQLVDDLGHLKYNEFQLYVENNFQFRRHPDMYDDTDPLTAEELLLIDEACRARHIDFVPSLTSLGHFEKILGRPRYRPLAEAEPAQLKAINATCWYEAAPWSLAVVDPAARQLLKDMYDEFAPNFTSREFNICCDESYDLGVVRSKDEADRVGGVGQLYVNWINYCRDLAGAHGKTIQMWGDIILKYPDLIGQLPERAVLLEWGYEHDHKFDEHCALFAERLKSKGGKGRSFYVAPGTSSWLTFSSRTQNAFGNIHNAATAGLKHGATGLLVTDWGDNGHQQMLAMSLPALACGAAASWNLAASPNPATIPNQKSEIKNQKSALASLLSATSLHMFHDPSREFAALAYDLGLTYLRFGWQRFNASVDWFLFREKWDFANYVNRVQPRDVARVIAATEALKKRFAAAALGRAQAAETVAEFVFTCDQIIHTCRRTLLRQRWLAADPKVRNPEEPALNKKKAVPLPNTFRAEMRALAADAKSLRARFEKLWLARNKRSRVQDVVVEFDRLIAEYGAFGR